MARVVGRVHLASGEPLSSPLGGRACAFYEVRGGLLERGETAARDFYVEDDSGRALVVMEDFRVRMAGRQQRRVIAALDADIQVISEQIRELKQQRSRGTPSEQRAALPRLKNLRRLATVLCAVRAHAHGKLHVGKNQQQQLDFIQRNSEAFRAEGSALRSTRLTVRRHEVTLEQGFPVVVTGRCRLEPARDPAAATGGGYRGTAMQPTLRAPAGGELLVEGQGELADPEPPERDAAGDQQVRRRRPRGQSQPDRLGLRVAAAIVTAVVVGIAIMQC
jgi:hypothetical protein